MFNSKISLIAAVLVVALLVGCAPGDDIDIPAGEEPDIEGNGVQESDDSMPPPPPSDDQTSSSDDGGQQDDSMPPPPPRI